MDKDKEKVRRSNRRVGWAIGYVRSYMNRPIYEQDGVQVRKKLHEKRLAGD